MKNFNFFIEHQCPQCGAPVMLEETDRLFECEFCHVKSYLVCKDYFRYMLPNNAPKNVELLYYPYWRFKGMIFSCTMQDIRNSFVDFSYQAIESKYFPVSVGFRSQALKMKFVSPDTEGSFLKPSLSYEDVMKMFTKRFSAGIAEPVLYQTHIGEAVSLIYSPFYRDKGVYDAVLNKQVAPQLPDDSGFQGNRPDWNIEFIPTICPGCGWDLQGARDSLALVCRNCNKIWIPVKKKLRLLKTARIRHRNVTDMWLPFWRIKATVSGITLNSYADLIRTANLPKVPQPKYDDIEFYFWTLAFKVRPQVFLRIARIVTLLQPCDELIPELPKETLYPVTLPVTEVSDSLKIVLAGFMKPQEMLLPMLSGITIQPESFTLVYIPFVEGTHEFIQPKFNFAINKNHLRLSHNL